MSQGPLRVGKKKAWVKKHNLLINTDHVTHAVNDGITLSDSSCA
jgi:hypothetical protein